MKVALATCASLPAGDGDDADVPGALADIGVESAWLRWGPETDTDTDTDTDADLVVLRSTWDYPERAAEFLSWCESVPVLANPAGVVKWNLDKAYLVDLIEAGVPVVPTAVATPGFDAWPEGEFVVKPTVGAGSRGALRVAAGDHEAAAAHLAGLGGPALVQPYQADVDHVGETALVFFGGRYSHAFTKGAMLVPDTVTDPTGLYLVERLDRAEPDAARRRTAEDVLDAATGLLGVRRADLLYARVDLIPGVDGRPLLLELELVEPSLGFGLADPGAPARFASAVRAALVDLP
ncbi:hypothetical protein GCM10022243_44420 [Saccharothrix violaceirubra]|uniref:ATP-grasp domain-containing protein n=1 Tax=Saccharothrix violaceirubra TaxID=413306 RepID=A0A7W7WVL9_9PSEU|nr:hypothetical protein [Saccharothrix violaceirubra]MBB4964668.1 hypothetical protein [Saccharothrix violaceirubra]